MPPHLLTARRIGLYSWLGAAVSMMLVIAASNFGYESLSRTLRFALWACGVVFAASVVFTIGSIAVLLVKAIACGRNGG